MAAIAAAVAIGASAAIGAGVSWYASDQASKKADEASRRAENAQNAANDIQRENLLFQKQQYDDWKDIFGDTEQQLKSYYNSLSADSVAALNIQSMQTEFASARENLERELATRGLQDSGALAQGLTQLNTAQAIGNANARTSAPQQVADQKANFLGIGLGGKANAQQGITNAYNNQAMLQSNYANTQLQLQSDYNQASGAAAAGIGKSIGSGAGLYLKYKALSGTSSTGAKK